jgi:hypothetical protein
MAIIMGETRRGLFGRRDAQPVEIPEGPVRGLPVWYFPIMGGMAGAYDFFQAAPKVMLIALPVMIVANLALTLTVLRTRMRLMKALWKNRRTRMLAFALLGVRMALRFTIGAAMTALAAVTGHVVIGILMMVIGAAMAYGDQWLILRTLERSRASVAVPAQALAA